MSRTPSPFDFASWSNSLFAYSNVPILSSYAWTYRLLIKPPATVHDNLWKILLVSSLTSCSVRPLFQEQLENLIFLVAMCVQSVLVYYESARLMQNFIFLFFVIFFTFGFCLLSLSFKFIFVSFYFYFIFDFQLKFIFNSFYYCFSANKRLI